MLTKKAIRIAAGKVVVSPPAVVATMSVPQTASTRTAAHMPRIATAAQNGLQYIHTTRRGAWTASCGVLMAPPFAAILRPSAPGPHP